MTFPHGGIPPLAPMLTALLGDSANAPFQPQPDADDAPGALRAMATQMDADASRRTTVHYSHTAC